GSASWPRRTWPPRCTPAPATTRKAGWRTTRPSTSRSPPGLRRPTTPRSPSRATAAAPRPTSPSRRSRPSPGSRAPRRSRPRRWFVSNRRRRTPADLVANADGLAAIEFGLILPILFLLLVGIIQFAWTVHCAASVRWALDASGRALMINPSLTADDLRTTMVGKLKGIADTKNLTLTVT